MSGAASEGFGPFGGRVWLNCAHQGPLPDVAVEAVREAVAWKVAPALLDDDRFHSVPDQLKQAIGRLIDAPPSQVVLGNSTSYGLHLLANGIPWKAGDEILLIEGDFPAAILPWLSLRGRGVTIGFLKPQGPIPTTDELAGALNARTRLFCASWVNSFNGYALDLDAVGEVCRSRDVLFILNGSQAVGSLPISVSTSCVDALSTCGFKWQCGPYGTGFLWLSSELLDQLEYNQAYWLAMQRGRGLHDMRTYKVRDDLGASAYDVFCTANFLNFLPWMASIEHLLQVGLHQIHAHNSLLVDQLVGGLIDLGYHVPSPHEGPSRSPLVFFTAGTEEQNTRLLAHLKGAGIDISLREGLLRVSPHLYNTTTEIDRLLAGLDVALSSG